MKSKSSNVRISVCYGMKNIREYDWNAFPFIKKIVSKDRNFQFKNIFKLKNSKNSMEGVRIFPTMREENIAGTFALFSLAIVGTFKYYPSKKYHSLSRRQLECSTNEMKCEYYYKLLAY